MDTRTLEDSLTDEQFIEQTTKQFDLYLEGERQQEKEEFRKIEFETYRHAPGFYIKQGDRFVGATCEEDEIKFWLREGVKVEYKDGRWVFEA